MSRIADLLARMAAIPDKERRATQLGEMTAVRDKLRKSATLADELRGLTGALEMIDGADFVDKVKQGLAMASSSAIRLKARFESGSGFERKRADETLTSINERLENASNTVTKGWRLLIDDQAKRFKPLAEAAERASLPGAVGLNSAISLLEGWRENPPATLKEAELFVATAARIPASIANLGLEGRAGRFMVDASNGRAKAKDLQETEVIAFLDAHPAVWSLLKVGF